MVVGGQAQDLGSHPGDFLRSFVGSRGLFLISEAVAGTLQ